MANLHTSILFAFIAVGTSFAGVRKGPPVPASRAITGDEVRHTLPARVIPSYPLAAPGDSITFTTYDYGTNGSVNRNIVNYGSGVVSFARMMAQTLDPSTPDRGSWYNYSTNGGRTWRYPWYRVEVTRHGWTNIDQIRDFGGLEVLVSHSGAVLPLTVSVDADRGANSWLSTFTSCPGLGPRLAIGSGLSLHIIHTVGGSPPTWLGYTRSTDGGISFDRGCVNIFPSNIGVSRDGYAASARGNKVALLVAGQASDVVLLTSTDRGDSWDTTTVYDITRPPPAPQFQPDGSCDVLIDGAGIVHVVWSNFLNIADTLYYSIDAPIMYWNSASGVIRNIAYPVQDTTLGRPPGRSGNYATQPDLGANSGGSGIYCTFSQLISERDPANLNYSHVYAVASSDGGMTWGPAIDITLGSGFDATFPTIPDLVEDTMYVAYFADRLAGNFISVNHAQTQVALMWLRVPVSSITDVREVDSEQLPGVYALEQNYPNPFNSGTRFRFRIAEFGLVRLVVYNVLGQEVATVVNEFKQAGRYEVTWDARQTAGGLARGLPSGVYFYGLSAGAFTATRKLLIVK